MGKKETNTVILIFSIALIINCYNLHSQQKIILLV